MNTAVIKTLMIRKPKLHLKLESNAHPSKAAYTGKTDRGLVVFIQQVIDGKGQG